MQNVAGVAAVIPAAGVGSRMGLSEPKQYLQLAGQTVLEHSVAAVISDARVQAVYIAIAADDQRVTSLNFNSHCDIHFVQGGSSRAASVLAGVKQAQMDGFTTVVVHDAARPCLQPDELSAVISAGLSNADGAILALPLADTVKRARRDDSEVLKRIATTVARDNLWRALTPQVFGAERLCQALEQLGVDNPLITDEASAIELLGGHPLLVPGRQTNIKITQPGDEQLAALYLTTLFKEPTCV
ncbi:2-C-methyl-D-erythritol 4-phosphate cytidylyltransferase [Pseudidiomarina gelatinasegens]|jgi:2-C-methyl-D-erythritol 4-phosphate cytidylyltransferase|uniref:2-C-methyl-D-erythritol 4-phosphate cytidylyltransferase n=1 Tax=Pseudidiomarina gelatinasegens TaxID=2487740 RepID=A0A443Z6A5_9GAMM|nr:2-C-methyl-D-erythritol 4-phosphate cytidylyltransferase [Pseudidiomarina gelatinasegens]RWU12264.1 2-C-methyl-D-erythritol 4-phosphate cytidylyltransferase [Pseudidiomarina gelatinasegens]